MKIFLEKYGDEEVLILSEKPYLKHLVEAISKENGLYNFTYLAVEDLVKLKYFDFKDRTSAIIANKFKVVPEVARVYLKNLKFIKLLEDKPLNEIEQIKFDNLNKYYLELVKEDLINDNSDYLAYLKTKKIVYLSNHSLNNEYRLLLNDFEIEEYLINFETKMDLVINSSENIHDLYFYVFEEVAKLVHSGVKQSDIYLVCNEDNNLRLYLDLYDFNLNDSKNSLYSYRLIRNELDKLKNGTFKLENLERNSLTEKLVKILEKYDLTSDYTSILEEVKRTGVNLEIKEDALNIISVDEAIFLENKHIFIFPLNETVLPKLSKDEDYFLDYTKSKYGLVTTLDKNILAKNNLLDLVNSNNEVYLYNYKKDVKKEFKVSTCLDYLTVKDLSVDYYSNYSDSLNKILLTRYMDYYHKYQKHYKSLDKLVSTYGNSYNSYDNSFKPFSYEIKDDTIELSYSSFTRLRECSFTYYIDKILGLNISDSTMYTVIGNVFHEVLEKSYSDDFDFDLAYDNAVSKYLEEDKFTNSDKEYLYILKDKLVTILEKVREIDTKHDFTNHLLEEKFDLNIPFDYHEKTYKIHLKGFIDKLYYKEEYGKTYITLVDYKTGSSDVVNLADIKDGLHMQLAVYIYLVLKSGRFENPVISGVYLHKIFDNLEKLDGYTNIDEKKNCFDKEFLISGKSEFIKGLSLKKDGTLAKSSKVFTNADIEIIMEETEGWLIKLAKRIIDHDISISPDVETTISAVPYNELSFISYKDLKWEDLEDEVDA